MNPLYDYILEKTKAEIATLREALAIYDTPNMTALHCAESPGVSRTERQTPNNGLPSIDQASDSRVWQ